MGATDIGHGVLIRRIEGGLEWKHPACRAWSYLYFKPDARSTGHVLVQHEPLTIQGSLLCPGGCGTHGTIENGKWVPA
jgi:hypothetical protein